MNHAEFLQELGHAVQAQRSNTGDDLRAAFTWLVAEDLVECGETNEFIACHHKAPRGLQIDGAGFHLEDATLDLFLTEYSDGEEVESLTKTGIVQRFRRLENFFVRASHGKFEGEFEPNSPQADAVMRIRANLQEIRRVRFFLLTNHLLSDRVTEISNKTDAGRVWTYRVWDLDRIRNLRGYGEPEDIVINFDEMFGEPLRALAAAVDNAALESYLTVIPGDWLAAIYESFGGRLLEQNVRTFLQARGAVNKGIRQTILTEPENFFPYNNGISATAEEAGITRSDGTVEIHSVRKLQIVNGAQTTASLYNCLKRDKGVELEKIHVQMKLTVIDDPDKFVEMVPRISRYSNSQNKISNVDFFSNHPFHVWFEKQSRRILAPAVGGSQVPTRWFYERARGQHAHEMAWLSPGKKQQYLLQNPRHQVITKTDLAKYFNTFQMMPEEVSKGGERNFLAFAKYISDRWDKAKADFSDLWFQQAVAMVITFRTLETLISRAPWYSGGYRANLVTYGIALLLHALAREGRAFDTKRVWLRQELPTTVREQLLSICKDVLERIVVAAEDYGVKNVTEWCKKDHCWEDLKRTVVVDLKSLAWMSP